MLFRINKLFGKYKSPEGVIWSPKNYWYVRRHFHDLPQRASIHTYFDPSLRNHMIILGDAPYIAGRGTPVNIGEISIEPKNV